MRVPLLLTILAAAATMFATTPTKKYSELYEQRASLFDVLGCDSTSIVMLGNSLTHGCEWHELFNNPKVLNRGINGDIIEGIEDRLDVIVNGHPAKIFLLIGANDISHDLTADSIANAIGKLIDQLRRRTPQTRVYVQSILPINNSFGRYKLMVGKESVIRRINSLLEGIAVSKGCVWLNSHPIFCDEDGNLRRDWTNDGLHLLGEGYIAWRDFLLPYINE